jgi:Zn-dependent protease with chaperone function
MFSLVISVSTAVLAMLAVPIGALILAGYRRVDLDDRFFQAVGKYDQQIAATLRSRGISPESFCAADFERAYIKACGPFEDLYYFEWGALAACLLGVTALALAILVPVATGHSRKWLAVVFSPTVRLVTLSVGISFCLQALLAAYGVYLLESHAIGRLHLQLVGAIGIGGLIAGVLVLKSTFSIFRPMPMFVVGKRLVPAEEPTFFARLAALAGKIGATRPANVVIGLEPNFFVTSAPVQIVGEPHPMRGSTLYLSAPLMRLLTSAELDAVIGHEFGHFSGEDTLYSMRFAPAYRTLHEALSAVARHAARGGLISAMAIPARSMMNFCLLQFARSERRISREREHLADRAGASIAGPTPLVTALLKVGIYGPLWEPLLASTVETLNGGKAFTNMSEVFGTMSTDYGGEDMPTKMEECARAALAHPTDTHPTTRERIAALNLNLGEIAADQVLPAKAEQAALELTTLSAIEETLSDTYQHLLVTSGQAVPSAAARV